VFHEYFLNAQPRAEPGARRWPGRRSARRLARFFANPDLQAFTAEITITEAAAPA
jgi:hypothetical protein